DWERAIKEVVRVTKPGGWVEIMEKDLYWYNEGPFCKAARTAVAEALRETKNMEIILSPIIPPILSSISNLESNINHEERNVPFGEWGGKLGTIYKDLYTWGAKNLKTFMTGIGFNEEEWDETVDICMKQLNDRKGFDKIHRFWAMKKLEP
ncbi:1985_t:CDS:2, partial [Dentiscutata erythropus]